MEKELKKAIKERHYIIRNNQNAKRFILNRKLAKVNNIIEMHKRQQFKIINNDLWWDSKLSAAAKKKVPKGQMRLLN